jgi:pyruvate dehydrogenase phosphatase
MSKICYVEDKRVGCYDTHHTRDDMNTQFTSKLNVSSGLFEPNFKVHQASFQAYKSNNEDRTAVLGTDYGLIVGVFDGTHTKFLIPHYQLR